MNKLAMLRLVLAAITATAVAAACSPTTAHPVGEISVRNESAQAVRVEIDRPGNWPGSLFGPEQMVWWVPPWQEGWCPAATIGLTDDGMADTLPASHITVSGPSLAQPADFPGTAARILAGGLALTVDAGGAVTVEAAQPALPPGCQNYPLQTGP